MELVILYRHKKKPVVLHIGRENYWNTGDKQ